jgi:hypothetical protein
VKLADGQLRTGLVAAGALAVAAGLAVGVLISPTLTFYAFAALGLAAAGALATVLCRRQPWVYLTALAATVALTPKTGATPLVSVGISVFPVDVLLAVGIASAVLGFRALSRRMSGTGLIALLFVVLLGLQVARGFDLHSTVAVVEARNFVPAIGAALFLLSLDEKHDVPKLIRQWFYVTAITLSVLALFYAATRGIGSANYSDVLDDGSTTTSRVIPSWQAVAVAGALVVALRDAINGRGKRFGLAALLFAIVILIAQHRSVWAATAVAVAAYMLLERRRQGTLLAMFFVAWGLLLVVPIVIWSGTDLVGILVDSLQTASLSEGTGGARAASNGVFIEQIFSEPDPLTWLFGYPFGNGWTRFAWGRVLTYSPHSAYVEALLRVGLVGAVALVAIFVAALVRTLRHPERAALVLLLVTYTLAYGMPLVAGPILAFAFSTPREARPELTSRDEPTSRRHLRAGPHLAPKR